MAYPKPGKGFDVNKYDTKATKTGNKFKRNSREVISPGISPIQRGSSKLTVTRIPTGKNKPMSMTYGGTNRGKGTTKIVSRKKA